MVMNKRKESRKDKRIKRLERDMEELKARASHNWGLYMKERSAHNKLKGTIINDGLTENRTIKSLNATLRLKQQSIDYLKDMIRKIADVVGSNDMDYVAKMLEEMFHDMRRLLSLAQCPNAPCSCARSTLVNRLASRYRQHYYSNYKGSDGKTYVHRWIDGFDEDKGCGT